MLRGKLLKAGMLLPLILIAGCGTRPVGVAVETACPAPPAVPAVLRTLPPEATLDFEALILDAFGPSETPR